MGNKYSSINKLNWLNKEHKSEVFKTVSMSSLKQDDDDDDVTAAIRWVYLTSGWIHARYVLKWT